MLIEQFKNISLIGRIAYGIMCAEEYFIAKYPQKDWSIVFKKYWEVTKLDFWDNWTDEVMEYIPEYLFEFKDYKSSNFEYLTEEKYHKLVKLYQNVDNDVNIILKMVYHLANSHAYTSISGYGKESLYNLNDIILFLQQNAIELPNFKKVENFYFSYRNGWGNSFDGTYLSKIVKKET